MKDLLFYVFDSILHCSNVSKSDYQLGGEDCWRLDLDSCIIVITRSELDLLKKIYQDKMVYMSADSMRCWSKLMSLE